jgi:hypothetical protein
MAPTSFTPPGIIMTQVNRYFLHSREELTLRSFTKVGRPTELRLELPMYDSLMLMMRLHELEEDPNKDEILKMDNPCVRTNIRKKKVCLYSREDI